MNKGDELGLISDPFGLTENAVEAPTSGLIVGRTNLPSVNQGDALFHIAALPKSSATDDLIDTLETDLEGDPIFDEDEII